jgi:predicted phosphoadenosine phosphosulfate sulfurtransferase
MNRCYHCGIPDVIPEKLINSGRVPCYKSIAIAILKNDHSLKSLGFNINISEYYYEIKKSKENKESLQVELF